MRRALSGISSRFHRLLPRRVRRARRARGDAAHDGGPVHVRGGSAAGSSDNYLAQSRTDGGRCGVDDVRARRVGLQHHPRPRRAWRHHPLALQGRVPFSAREGRGGAAGRGGARRLQRQRHALLHRGGLPHRRGDAAWRAGPLHLPADRQRRGGARDRAAGCGGAGGGRVVRRCAADDGGGGLCVPPR